MTEANLKEQIKTSKSYRELLLSLKEKLQSSQIKAAVSVNVELIQLYWEIGVEIVEKQEKEGWGTKVIDRLAKDLKGVFPGMKGFSSRNLF